MIFTLIKYAYKRKRDKDIIYSDKHQILEISQNYSYWSMLVTRHN